MEGSDPVGSKRNLARALFERRIRRARTDLITFVETVVRDHHGHFLRVEPIQRQWMEHVLYCWRHRLRPIVLAPWGHGKTSTLSIPILAWRIGRDPNVRVKIISADGGNAIKRANALKQIIESPLYGRVFPHVHRGLKWGIEEFTIERDGNAVDPTVQARGIFATGIGGRADIELFDDIVDQRNAFDPAMRMKVLDFVENTWLSRLEPDGQVLWVATLWHTADATSQLVQRTGWSTLVHAISDDCESIEASVIGLPNLDGYPAA